MKQKQTAVRFSEEQTQWLEKQAKAKGCSKNDVLRLLIAEQIEKDTIKETNTA